MTIPEKRYGVNFFFGAADYLRVMPQNQTRLTFPVVGMVKASRPQTPHHFAVLYRTQKTGPIILSQSLTRGNRSGCAGGLCGIVVIILVVPGLSTVPVNLVCFFDKFGEVPHDFLELSPSVQRLCRNVRGKPEDVRKDMAHVGSIGLILRMLPRTILINHKDPLPVVQGDDPRAFSHDALDVWAIVVLVIEVHCPLGIPNHFHPHDWGMGVHPIPEGQNVAMPFKL